jgi:hypothetical protein
MRNYNVENFAVSMGCFPHAGFSGANAGFSAGDCAAAIENDAGI